MSSLDTKDVHAPRRATLKLTHGEDMPVFSARVPSNMPGEEFGRVATSAFDLISKLMAHPCMSDRTKFIVEDMFLNDVTGVDLRTGQMT